jgi:hypothetical protein
MPFIISICLSLLVLSAGLFLFAKSKEGLGKLFKIMAWIITVCGILLVLLSIQMAACKCISRHCGDKACTEDALFHKGCMPGGPECFGRMGNEMDKEGCGFCCEGPGHMKVKVFKNFIDDGEDEGEVEAVVKVVTDSLKLTPEQEKKIKIAVENALK